MNKNDWLAIFLCLILSLINLTGFGQENNRKQEILPPITPTGIPANEVDIRYGSHKRNVFDLWIANTEQPAPLVIFIHGGGFRSGDKSKVYNRKDIDFYLNHGISFASINYRYMTGDSLGVRASLYDSKRALQFIRSRAREWNIDKNRIACYGGSAGAGTSLWLAFHDDMADPENKDPVLRESTRIQAAGATGTQATYNLARWSDILALDVEELNTPQVLRFYGINSSEEINTPDGQAVLAELDMLEMMEGSFLFALITWHEFWEVAFYATAGFTALSIPYAKTWHFRFKRSSAALNNISSRGTLSIDPVLFHAEFNERIPGIKIRFAF